MKRICKLLILIFCQPVFASDWYIVSLDNLTTISVDRSSIRSSSGILKAWVEYSFLKEHKTEENPPKKYKVIRSFEEFDCNERKSAIAEMILYESKESLDVIDRISNEPYPTYRNIAPDSKAEIILDYVCKEAKKYG